MAFIISDQSLSERESGICYEAVGQVLVMADHERQILACDNAFSTTDPKLTLVKK